jgi:hypothetical protein
MNVYIIPFQFYPNNKFGIELTNFWKFNNNLTTYNILVNYVIYGRDASNEYDEYGHYAFGQFYIQPKKDSTGLLNPNIKVFNQQKEGIQNVYSDDTRGVPYLWIDVPGIQQAPGANTVQYYMKCTVI